MAAKKKKRQSYTKEQREGVLADVRTIGVSATARKHGVPQTSVSGWLRARSREGLTVAAGRRKTPRSEGGLALGGPEWTVVTTTSKDTASRVAELIETVAMRGKLARQRARDG